ncbi:hypothetical protein WJX74_005424 [Apatococcus lobatus]|uniref:Uncharacterized protein n=1 Tax=Apatococcus lobatus TaxID=904363 RepID=A0AAW1RKR5_9CHLO
MTAEKRSHKSKSGRTPAQHRLQQHVRHAPALKRTSASSCWRASKLPSVWRTDGANRLVQTPAASPHRTMRIQYRRVGGGEGGGFVGKRRSGFVQTWSAAVVVQRKGGQGEHRTAWRQNPHDYQRAT